MQEFFAEEVLGVKRAPLEISAGHYYPRDKSKLRYHPQKISEVFEKSFLNSRIDPFFSPHPNVITPSHDAL
jgi:hypothetical protein